MKILIIKLSSIGDVVHTLPSLYALRRGLGDGVEIDWLVEEAASAILKGHPLIDNVIVVKNRGWTREKAENMKTARRLAARRYDMVLDFQGLLKSGIWVLLSKGRRRIGFSNSRELSHIFLNEKLPAYDPDMHAVERYLALARHAGGVTDGVVFPLELDTELKTVKRLLEDNGVSEGGGGGKSFFVMVPRARWSTKLWDDEKFMEFGKKARERWGLKAVIVGGPGDKAPLERIKKGIGEGALNLAGAINLKELAALSSLARFVLTVDSGPMHVAAAAGARVVALFGPTAPWRTGPYGKGHVVVRKDIECSPCFLKNCPDPKCMREIGVEEVLDATEETFL
ncbi:MAG TPA: glycosyltransferase family 9 protein [Thermodesulfobacteriota bacterium]|nr:glycosyltransferase family 9 protein [Thermodesulfobacteriota bacterium]